MFKEKSVYLKNVEYFSSKETCIFGFVTKIFVLTVTDIAWQCTANGVGKSY